MGLREATKSRKPVMYSSRRWDVKKEEADYGGLGDQTFFKCTLSCSSTTYFRNDPGQVI